MKQPVKRWFRWLSPQLARYTALVGTTGLTICLVLLLGVAWLYQEVFEREAFRLDTTILPGIHQWANPALDRVVLSLTRLGDPEFMVVTVHFPPCHAASTALPLASSQRLGSVVHIWACIVPLTLLQATPLAFSSSPFALSYSDSIHKQNKTLFTSFPAWA